MPDSDIGCSLHPFSPVTTGSGRCQECITNYNEETRPYLSAIHSRAEELKQLKANRMDTQFDLAGRLERAWSRFQQRTEEYKNSIDYNLVTEEDILSKLESQGHQCVGCFADFSVEPFEIEHIVPVAHGGKHTAKNIQLLCRSCNSSKGNLPNEDWLSKMRYNQVIEYLLAEENLEHD